MTTTFIFLAKLVFTLVLLAATVATTLIVAPFMLAGWILDRENSPLWKSE